MKTSFVRDQILTTASELFYRRGYNSTGINQIIDEDGIAKASLYQHFKSKEDLLSEYLKLAAKNTNDGLKKAIESQVDPKKKVGAVFDFLAEFSKKTGCGGCNFLNVISEVPAENTRITGQIKKQKNVIREMFGTIMRPIGKSGLADEMYLLFDAALISSRVQNDTWPILKAKKMALALI